jgi:hypothetical protein
MVLWPHLAVSSRHGGVRRSSDSAVALHTAQQATAGAAEDAAATTEEDEAATAAAIRYPAGAERGAA